MQEIKFDEAMELCLQGGRDDICVMQPQPVADMPLRQVRELGEAGAVFALLPGGSLQALGRRSWILIRWRP